MTNYHQIITKSSPKYHELSLNYNQMITKS